MELAERLLAWCRQERDMSQGIVDDIKKGAIHRAGPVGGPHRDVTAELLDREAATVEYLERFIDDLAKP